MPVRAVVKLARRLGDRGVRDRSSLISPMVARQIREKHSMKSSVALRTRRDQLARSARSRQLSKAEEQEYRKLVSVFGLPTASSMRPTSKKSGGGSTTMRAQNFSSEKAPREQQGSRKNAVSGQGTTRPANSVAIATLAQELHLSADYIAMLAGKYGVGSDAEYPKVPADIAKVIRSAYGLRTTVAKRKRYQLLKRQLARKPGVGKSQEFGELKFMFEGKEKPKGSRTKPPAKTKPRSGQKPSTPPRRVCRLCRKEFYSTEPSHGCALDRRTPRLNDLPPIKPVKSKRQPRPSVFGPEYDISPRSGGLEVPNGHPGTGRRR